MNLFVCTVKTVPTANAAAVVEFPDGIQRELDKEDELIVTVYAVDDVVLVAYDPYNAGDVVAVAVLVDAPTA